MPIAALLRETCSSSTGRSIQTRIKEFDELGNSTVSEQPILAVPRMSSGASFLVRSFRAHDRQQLARFDVRLLKDTVGSQGSLGKVDIDGQYFRRSQNHFWVADALGQIVGTIAVRTEDENIAHISCLRTVEDSLDQAIQNGLIQVAASHVRRLGCLKLMIHAQLDVGCASHFLHRLGFRYSRHRGVKQDLVLEFYLNLYESPKLAVQETNC